MKLYVMDCGWRGSIVVVANSLEEARISMEDEYNYEENNKIQEFPINTDFKWCDMGDC